MTQATLSKKFTPHLPSEVRQAFRGQPDLDDRLKRLLLTARETWPGVEVADGDFLKFVAERVDADSDPETALEKLRSDDLYLALGCWLGDEEAVRAFRTRFYREMDRGLARLNLAKSVVEDVKQAVFEKLFMGGPQGPARIVQYSGRGTLRNWVRVTATRLALNLIRDSSRERYLEPDLLIQRAATDEDQELVYLKELYREEFKEAFRQALGGLSTKERNVLRYYHIEGLTIDEIGRIYRVHRATPARWLHRIREKLLRDTRAALVDQLSIEASQADSIIRLVQSRLDVSIVRHLKT